MSWSFWGTEAHTWQKMIPAESYRNIKHAKSLILGTGVQILLVSPSKPYAAQQTGMLLVDGYLKLQILLC